MNDNLSQVEQRTQRYWFEDGLWEIGFGIANMILGLYFLATLRFEFGTLIELVLQFLVIITVFFLLGRFVKFTKERITYPRTGFVAYRKPAGAVRVRRILLRVLLSAGIAAIVGFASTIVLVQNTAALVTGIVMAAALVYCGYRFQLSRLYVVAALTALFGFGISILTLTDTEVTALFFGGFGALMAISGGITLLLYILHTRPANPDDLDLSDLQ